MTAEKVMSKQKTNKHPWGNRIIEHGQAPANQFLAHELNARRHPGPQREALIGSLNQVGWVAPVIVSSRTGKLLDGHARVEEALTKDEYQLIPFVKVDVTEEEERTILATYDPITGLAEYDREALSNLLELVNTQEDGLQAILADLAAIAEPIEAVATAQAEEDEMYTRKIEAPIYEVTGECPSTRELFDDSKTRALKTRIVEADLPNDVTEFLLQAAERHTVFNFKGIAEYYAHATSQVQRLMEESALVIIDFDAAIENGYVKLTKQLIEYYQEDYADEE